MALIRLLTAGSALTLALGAESPTLANRSRAERACRPVYTWWDPARPPISLDITTNETLRAVAKGVSDIVMLGWVTDHSGSLEFTQGGAVPESKALWVAQRTKLQALGFRVHAYIELNPGGTSNCATNATAAAFFLAQVGSLMAEGWDGLQVSVEGCGPAQKPLIPHYQDFIARLKQQLGDGKELAVWIHEYCNERSDFCMTCADYRAAIGFDRVIYYGPQYWGYLSAAKIALIGQAQAELGTAGTVSTP